MSNSSGGHEFNDDNHGTRPVSPSRLKSEIGPSWRGPVHALTCSRTSLQTPSSARTPPVMTQSQWRPALSWLARRHSSSNPPRRRCYDVYADN